MCIAESEVERRLESASGVHRHGASELNNKTSLDDLLMMK
jgi:hypothetical protein